MQVTPNIKLELYEGSDKPNLRDQYNNSMLTLDEVILALQNKNIATDNQIHTINTTVDNVTNELTTVKTTVDANTTAITAIENKQTIMEGEFADVKTSTENNTASIAQIKLDEETINSEMTNISNEQTNQRAYWQALGVDTVESAQGLHDDIDDAYSTAMTNQADIVEIKQKNTQQDTNINANTANINANTAKINANTAKINTLNTNVGNNSMFGAAIISTWNGPNSELITRAYSANKQYVRFYGDCFITTSITTVAIPGWSNWYGIKTTFKMDFTPTSTARVFSNVGVQIPISGGSAESYGVPVHIAVGTDGYVYMFCWSHQVPKGAWRFLQIPLVLNTSGYIPPVQTRATSDDPEPHMPGIPATAIPYTPDTYIDYLSENAY